MASSAQMQGWELAALFLFFLFINIIWDSLVGMLTFLNNILRGRKANWLTRVKDELLALGVVSLVLLFVEPSLQHFCIPTGKASYSGDKRSSPPAEYGTYYCAAGSRQVFPKTVIHAAHYLLFYLAIVHILFSLLTSVITNIRLARWSVLERTARKEQNIPAVAFLRISSVIARANDPASLRPSIRLRDTLHDAIGYVDQDLYALLRFMCEKRFRAHSVVLRNFNFLNMCEQCLEAELNEVYSHAWLLVFMMALLLLYNRRIYQIVWMAFLCVAMMALMAGNMRWVMKKTAREARNLWRKVQGMGGLERDDDDEEEEEEEEAETEIDPAVGGLPNAALLQIQQLFHPHQQGVGGLATVVGKERRVGRSDLEPGDVGGLERVDQHQMASQGLHRQGRITKRPIKQLRFAPTMPRGLPGLRPVGESLERCSDGLDGGMDSQPQAPGSAPPGPIEPTALTATVAAEAATAGWAAGRSHVVDSSNRFGDGGPSWKSCRTGGCAGWLVSTRGGDPCGGSACSRVGLVNLVDVCREVRATAEVAKVDSGRRRGSRVAAAVMGGLLQKGSGVRSCLHQEETWWKPCDAEVAPAGVTVRAAKAHNGAAAAEGVLGSWRKSWVLRLFGGSRAARRGGRAAVGETGRGCTGVRGTECRKRVLGRTNRLPGRGQGPVCEGSIKNPLYGINDSDTGGGGGGGLGRGGGAGTWRPGAQMGYPLQAYGSAMAGVYSVGGVSGLSAQLPASVLSYGMPAEEAIWNPATTAAAAAPFGSGGGNTSMGLSMGAATASSRYGVFAPTGSARMVATVSAVAQPQVLSQQPPAENGQWGSNPSSGNPEERDVLASRGSSSSGSASSSSVDGGGGGGSAHRPGHSSQGPGHKTSGKLENEEEEEEDVHSEKSIFEHELASGIEEKITRLFFFGRPFLLLWFFNIIFAQASLTMTMSMAFVIPYEKFDYIRDVAMPMYIWLPVVLTNLMLVFYGCWVFLPQYALLSVCGILEPHEVMEEIKRSKTSDKLEEGITGIVLDKLSDYFIGRHDGETRLSTAFIVTLASQAGIILGRDYKAQKFINKACLKPIYHEFVAVWHDIAWYGELKVPYMIKSDVPEFKEAFDELDEDGSGALSFGELANMIRSLGTYATAGDVEAMLWEIDIDNSHSIGYDEFVKFMVYAFIDTKQLGYIDTPALKDAMERLDLSLNEMQMAVLMSVGGCEPQQELKVTLRQFFSMFEKVVFEEVEQLKEAQEWVEAAAAARRASMLGRARGLLSASSSIFLRQPLPESSFQSAGDREAGNNGAQFGGKGGGAGMGTGGGVRQLAEAEYRRGVSGLSGGGGIGFGGGGGFGSDIGGFGGRIGGVGGNGFVGAGGGGFGGGIGMDENLNVGVIGGGGFSGAAGNGFGNGGHSPSAAGVIDGAPMSVISTGGFSGISGGLGGGGGDAGWNNVQMQQLPRSFVSSKW